MSDPSFPLRLDVFAQHLDVAPGNQIRLKGSYFMADGATVDAATTTWPDGTPGGAGVDAGGLVDLKAGGFHMASRDPVTHEVVAVATGQQAPGCEAAHVASPCLVLRTVQLAQSRYQMQDELKSGMKGGITIELVGAPPPPAVPAYTPVRDAMTSPLAIGAAGIVGCAAIAGLVWMVRRRQKLSPEGRMKDLAARVSKKLKRSDHTVFAALEPVVKKMLDAMASRRVDPRSKEGKRVLEVLTRVEARLDDTVEQARAAQEEAAADELVVEMENALEAASEVARL